MPSDLVMVRDTVCLTLGDFAEYDAHLVSRYAYGNDFKKAKGGWACKDLLAAIILVSGLTKWKDADHTMEMSPWRYGVYIVEFPFNKCVAASDDLILAAWFEKVGVRRLPKDAQVIGRVEQEAIDRLFMEYARAL